MAFAIGIMVWHGMMECAQRKLFSRLQTKTMVTTKWMFKATQFSLVILLLDQMCGETKKKEEEKKLKNETHFQLPHET